MPLRRRIQERFIREPRQPRCQTCRQLAPAAQVERQSESHFLSDVVSRCRKDLHHLIGLVLRRDGTIGQGAAQLEMYWYIAGDQLILCSLAADAVRLRESEPGVWKGRWLGFGQHEVTLEIHRAQTIVDILRSTNRGKLIGAEIGVWRGETSRYLLQSLPELHLHMIDAWKTYPQRAVTSCLKQANQETFDLARRQAVRATEFAANRRTIHHQDSVQSAERFEDASLEFVFIDAEHSYESVIADITAWHRKLKPGGILFGHDYGQPRFPGVKRAFDELFPGKLSQAPDFMVFHRKERA